MIKIGDRFQSSVGPLLVIQTADLADQYRIVTLIKEREPYAGTKYGVPRALSRDQLSASDKHIG